MLSLLAGGGLVVGLVSAFLLSITYPGRPGLFSKFVYLLVGFEVCKFTSRIRKNLSMDRFWKERVQPILGPGRARFMFVIAFLMPGGGSSIIRSANKLYILNQTSFSTKLYMRMIVENVKSIG